MASSKIKGITIEIGGITTKLGKALEGVNKQSKDLQRKIVLTDKRLEKPTETGDKISSII